MRGERPAALLSFTNLVRIHSAVIHVDRRGFLTSGLLIRQAPVLLGFLTQESFSIIQLLKSHF
jgi:hypothetical protein